MKEKALTPAEVTFRRMQHSKETKFEAFGRTLASVHKGIRPLRRVKKIVLPEDKWNVIPVNLRPWVPHRRRLLCSGSIVELAEYARKLRAVCTKDQWKTMEPRFWRLI